MSSLTIAPFLLGYSVTVSSLFENCMFVWIFVLRECVFVAWLKISSHKELQKAQSARMTERRGRVVLVGS